MDLNPMKIAAGITAALALIGSIIGFDARYAKQADIDSKLNNVKDQIINEMRTEIVRNRSVMISAMQREADDLEYQMMELQRHHKEVPRYMSDKHKQILRQIEALKEYDKQDK